MTTDARNRALVSLLHALRAVHKAVDPESVGLSAHEMKTNARQIAEGDWVAKAVRSAIDTETAIIVSSSVSGRGGG